MTRFQIEVNVFLVVDLIYLYASAITDDHFKKESEFFFANKINSHSVMLKVTAYDTKCNHWSFFFYRFKRSIISRCF